MVEKKKKNKSSKTPNPNPTPKSPIPILPPTLHPLSPPHLPRLPYPHLRPTLISATRRLLATAILDDPSNAFFAILSQHCIPLHSFNYVYDSLVNSRSFVLSSPDDPFSADDPSRLAGICLQYRSFIEIISKEPRLWKRYVARGRYSMLQEVPFEKFQVGSQFFVPTRRHALLVIKDRSLWKKFKFSCYQEDECYPEEHYCPTLLSMEDPNGCTNPRDTWQAVIGRPAVGGILDDIALFLTEEKDENVQLEGDLAQPETKSDAEKVVPETEVEKEAESSKTKSDAPRPKLPKHFSQTPTIQKSGARLVRPGTRAQTVFGRGRKKLGEKIVEVESDDDQSENSPVDVGEKSSKKRKRSDEDKEKSDDDLADEEPNDSDKEPDESDKAQKSDDEPENKSGSNKNGSYDEPDKGDDHDDDDKDDDEEEKEEDEDKEPEVEEESEKEEEPTPTPAKKKLKALTKSGSSKKAKKNYFTHTPTYTMVLNDLEGISVAKLLKDAKLTTLVTLKEQGKDGVADLLRQNYHSKINPQERLEEQRFT
ncbi:hypothetical protein Tsubulata_001497 [Turnera subulata]|uniref:Uncharacterized protein n=1 Tax=Turnera subulata TaxID=218843 RepID=A0A9Q0F1V5_9ROSI|nr:hypothetical protein Tsubulata_001497 [Turnera subulata]